MTKEQIEQVRARVEQGKHGCSCNAYDESCTECDADNAALAILDAELAKPEVREWRWIAGGTSYPYRDRAEMESDMNEHGVCDARIESRTICTPAGPWKAA